MDIDDIDEMRHVNHVVYLRYIQDMAIAHWISVVSAEMAAKTVWVVRRHEVDYLTVKTWVGEPTAATWERFTEIRRSEGDQVLVPARSVWVAVDAKTHRPKRIDPQLIALFE